MIPLQFAILGLGVGALYALIALGIVLIYRGSGVINFAQGAIGMGATYLYWSLHDNRHWAFAPAAAVAIVACAVLGVIIQFAVMRPLCHQSPLTRILATLGILITITSSAALRWPQAVQAVRSSLPTGTFKMGSLVIGKDKATIFLIVLALSAALWAVYRYTKFGIATTAVTDNALVASTVGISPDFVAAVNWAVGCAMAGLAGILLAPITGLSVEGLTLLSIPAFAAVVVGNFTSFPITLAAGLVLGIIQSEMGRYVDSTTGWAQSVPFFIVLVVLALRGRSLPAKGDTALRLPRVGSGRIRPWAVLLAGGICLLAIEKLSQNWVAGITTTLSAAVVVLSLVIVIGYAGQISLAQYALAGIGAFVAARLVAVDGLPFWAGCIIGVVAALPVGVVVGLPALRTRGANLAIATLGLAVAANALIFTNTSLSGGVSGLEVGSPSVFGVNLSPLINGRPYAIFTLILAVLTTICVANLRRSRTGRRLLAVRANERAAASLGIGVMSSKLYAFGVGSMVAALGGILIAFVNPSVELGGFDPLTSITYVGYAVIGGVGYATGPYFGSTLAPGAVGTNVADWFSHTVQDYLTLASGLILILILIFNANGVAHVEARRWSGYLHALRARAPRRIEGFLHIADRDRIVAEPRVVTGSLGREREPKILRVDNICVSFGGSKALDGVSLELQTGQIVGLIGPNGAGKTTLIDAITGFNRPTSGQVYIDGRALLPLTARRRAEAGLGRSFQSLELFEDLTVAENLLVASEKTSRWRQASDLFWPGRPVLSAVAEATIEQFDLRTDLLKLPSELPYGRRRLVAIARALAREPSILLLDEPAAGLSEDERNELSTLLRRLSGQFRVGVLLVEHDVELVMRTCDRIVCLDFGRVIAEGDPAETRRNTAVVKAYLGEEIVPGDSTAVSAS